jgi:uncharacterized protein with PIN domain
MQAKSFSVVVAFHGDLGFFIKTREKSQPVRRVLTDKTTVKDVIESFGVPHPEVDVIVANGEPVNFAFRLEANTNLDVYPVSTAFCPTLRLQARGVRAFVADGHLGKLTRDLRLLGIDVSYCRDASDPELLATMVKENRALLTRDRPLLMHRAVKTGYFPRSQDPTRQTIEVIRRFDLAQAFAPFTRCLRCNGLLTAVAKETVINELKPLTRTFYNDFQKCSECGQSYWRGSHVAKLEKRIKTILDQGES